MVGFKDRKTFKNKIILFTVLASNSGIKIEEKED